ncbi:NADP-dependent oxidoreductase domain-containing protein [Crepidotus variabilis]|uniref:NADP-dependent oxidoreductase domain-containing protein n=1 Tax=Crepidotus variabilis TaxID=179855 RepID=A0A9P6JRP6_9AGAR|nr:NADP-dependent oxidoreductase domain-containing protein [Crepidotus variabilis]
MSFGKTITLRGGLKMPQIGLGTWLSKPREVENAVEIAVRNGYRHLDLAMVYENQDEVGRALKKIIPSVVKREELFITSKLWNSGHQPAQVEKELDETLSQLGIDYLDLYLIHWPIAFAPGRGLFPAHPTKKGYVEIDTTTTLVDTWKAMIALPKSKVKAIGVSNFSVSAIKGIVEATGVVPEMNQVEAHPLLPQDDLVAYCKEQNIHMTAYSPLGNNMVNKPKLTDHPVVQEVAKKLNASTAQVLIAWGVQRGYTVIPKSIQEERIKSNFQQVELSEEDFKKITAIGHNNHARFNIPESYCDPIWDFNTFGEPEEAKCTYQVKVV